MPDQEVEVTLGTGKLLGLFFGMVVVCAIFFGLGYSMGKNAAPAGSLVGDAGPAVAQSGPKPAAGKAPEAAPAATPAQNDLTFYKSTEQKEANPKLTPVAEAKAPPAAPQAAAAAAPPPASQPHSGAGYVVQVAAVAKKDDAEALADALRKKSYPVFVMGNANDKLVRVQIGPFAELKQAEEMKAKLAADGYNAIVKR